MSQLFNMKYLHVLNMRIELRIRHNYNSNYSYLFPNLILYEEQAFINIQKSVGKTRNIELLKL